MNNNPGKLFIFTNFDGTTFNTFEPSPSKIGVHEAYELAIRKLLGDDGFEIYKNDLNGLQNREPGHLLDLLAKGFMNRGIEDIPPFLLKPRLERIREFVDLKLSYMLNDISSDWPKPYPGVVDFFRAVQNGELPVVVAVATSGHREFVEKVYRVNGLEPPKIMVTSDDINELVEPRRGLYRPHAYQVAVLHSYMLRLIRGNGYYIAEQNRFTDRGDGVKAHMVFMGDNPDTDAGIAEGGRMPLLFVPFRHPEFIQELSPRKGQILIPDFFALRQLIEDNRWNIEQGMSASEIFLGVPDSELFPPVEESERPYNVWLREMRRMPTISDEVERRKAESIVESTGFPIAPIGRGKEIV